jgi:hypothetical protein
VNDDIDCCCDEAAVSQLAICMVPGHPLPVYGKDYIDNPPFRAITAEQVRLNTELTADACQHEGKICCDAKRLRWVLEGLRNHPGMNAASKAVVEAALEPWPASPKT